MSRLFIFINIELNIRNYLSPKLGNLEISPKFPSPPLDPVLPPFSRLDAV